MLDCAGDLEPEHSVESGIAAIEDNQASTGNDDRANLNIISLKYFEEKAFDRSSEDDNPLSRATSNHPKILEHTKYLHNLYSLIETQEKIKLVNNYLWI